MLKGSTLASVFAKPDPLTQATQAEALFANPSPVIGAAALWLLVLVALVGVLARCCVPVAGPPKPGRG